MFAQQSTPALQDQHGSCRRIADGRQGGNAPGGAKRYVTADGMTGGYALVAWRPSGGETARDRVGTRDVARLVEARRRVGRREALGRGQRDRSRAR